MTQPLGVRTGIPWAISAGISAAFILFGIVCRSVNTPLPVDASRLMLIGTCGLVLSLTMLVRHGVRTAWSDDEALILALAALTGGVWFLFLGQLYRVACLLALPVDLLSYSESGFINDILRMELGLPIYAPPLENQSTVYTPGSQILTRWIGSLFGNPLEVTTLRTAQFMYVVLGVVAATAAADRLARVVAPTRYREPWLWMAWWAPTLFMVAIEPRFNAYTPSLNSDGLALCLSMVALLLMAQHALAPRTWHLVAMAVLPSVGFFVKQNLLAWAGVFTLYLFIAGLGLRKSSVFGVLAGLSGLCAVATAYWLWGSDFWFWAFTSFGPKTISLPRSLQHLLEAGAYAALGLSAGGMLLRRPLAAAELRALGIWIAWLSLLVLQAYTSGFAWAVNHLGSAVLIASVWFMVMTVYAWPRRTEFPQLWRFWAIQGTAIAVTLGILGGLGFPREPTNPVPSDFERYVAAIEREFANQNASRILMDYGSWPYAERRVLMKDRGFATHVHLEPNQPIAHQMLVDTIDRIRRGAYDKILVRGLDSGHSSYDFQNRGSGIREAIHEQYREVRRIPAVEGVDMWWPKHMLDEIQVFERRNSAPPHMSISNSGQAGGP
jgi:hypothetical protein